ncbi:MAG: flagellar assembly protein FliH [Gammaproteobacteria bacterium]|nr:flagellar assembly protein FliH [Gammaproteobacteria bacterium]
MSDSRRGPAAAATIERWRLPEVEGPIIGRPRDEHPGTAAAGKSLRHALEEADARGYEAGMSRARAEMSTRLAALEERIRRLDAALHVLTKPLEQLDADLESELAQLALGVGKQLARRELSMDPTQVIAILRESLALLPAAAREVRVHLHPEDAATVREHLTAPAGDRAWSIVEDPTLSRGGCVVHCQSSRIDARLEARIAAVTASVLGDERAAAREGQ